MLLFLEIRTDRSPRKFEFGKFGASNFSERLEPSIRKDGGTPRGAFFCRTYSNEIRQFLLQIFPALVALVVSAGF